MGQGRVKVYFDGGCRPNPGPIEVAVVVRGIVHLFDDLGSGSNSDAEWLALLRALEVAQSLGIIADAELIGDSREIIERANEILRCGEAGTGWATDFLSLAAKAPPARVRWIGRAQNLAGIALSRRHPR
jgi:ribonuclease HI